MAQRPRDPAVRASKFMSMVLRHRPEKIGLALDDHGWADLDKLVERSKGRLTHDLVRRAVAENNKQRFAISDDGKRIRARQGHSIPVDLDLEPRVPPEFLYHGTSPKAAISIRAEGLKRMDRNHVHLSSEVKTARAVGHRKRPSQPAIFRVRANEMWCDRHSFFVSENGVWLTDHVPPKYLECQHEWRRTGPDTLFCYGCQHELYEPQEK